MKRFVFSGAGKSGVLTGIVATNPAGNDDIHVSGHVDGMTIQNVDVGANHRFGILVADDSLAYQAGKVDTYSELRRPTLSPSRKMRAQ